MRTLYFCVIRHKTRRHTPVSPRNDPPTDPHPQTYVNFHFFVQSVIENQIMRHSNTVRFHRMTRSIIEITDFLCSQRTPPHDSRRRAESVSRILQTFTVSVSSSGFASFTVVKVSHFCSLHGEVTFSAEPEHEPHKMRCSQKTFRSTQPPPVVGMNHA